MHCLEFHLPSEGQDSSNQRRQSVDKAMPEVRKLHFLLFLLPLAGPTAAGFKGFTQVPAWVGSGRPQSPAGLGGASSSSLLPLPLPAPHKCLHNLRQQEQA